MRIRLTPISLLKKEIFYLIFTVLLILIAVNILPYGLRLGEIILFYAILTLTWLILYKYLGLFFLGTTGFVGLTIYVASILNSWLWSPLDLVTSLAIVGLILSGLLFLILRTYGGYFAILTLGLNLIFPQLLSSLDSSFFRISSRYLSYDQVISIASFYVGIIIFSCVTILYIYIDKPTKLKYTCLLIKHGKQIAESIGINYNIVRYLMSFIIFLIMASSGLIHITFLNRVDPQSLFQQSYTLLPIAAALLSVMRTRGSAFIDILICLFFPLLYFYLAVLFPTFVEISLGLTIFATLFVVMIRKIK